MIEAFIHAIERAGATVERIERTADALDAALRAVTEGTTSVLLAEPDALPAALFERFREAPQVVTDPTETDFVSADAGVTDAFAGVARTGSVCVTISSSLAGAVSLFPRLHVAVLDASTIVARPRDVFGHEGPAGNSGTRNFVFITGPSATADMGPLVRGVHGPERLHVIILDETK